MAKLLNLPLLPTNDHLLPRQLGESDMSASEQDSRVLDNERLKNDELRAENAVLRWELSLLKKKHEQQFRRIRDIMGEKE